MKPNNLFCTVLALALFACLMGCGKTGSEATSPTPTTARSEPATKSATANPPDIAGAYDVAGTNPTGTPYKGELAVDKRGDVYQFRWTAGKTYDGVGVANGNVVAVAFTEGSDGKGCGVVSYKVLADGALDGKWGYWGVNERGAEKATRTSGSGLAGAYDVTGNNPDGKQYKATLAITAKGGGYEFIWSNDSSGFGIKQGDVLSVGIGGERCAFVAYEVKPDGTLDGTWGGYGTDKTGTEKATKKK